VILIWLSLEKWPSQCRNHNFSRRREQKRCAARKLLGQPRGCSPKLCLPTMTLAPCLTRLDVETIIPPPAERSHGPSGALGPVHSSRGSSFKLVRGNCG